MIFIFRFPHFRQPQLLSFHQFVGAFAARTTSIGSRCLRLMSRCYRQFVYVCVTIGGRQRKYGLAETAFRQKYTLRTQKTQAKACGSDYIFGNLFPRISCNDGNGILTTLAFGIFPRWITEMPLRIPFAYRSRWSVTEICCRLDEFILSNAPSAPAYPFQVHPSCLFINSTDAIQFFYLPEPKIDG